MATQGCFCSDLMPFTSLGTLVCQRVNGQHWLKVGAGVSLISGISVIPVHPRAKRQSVSLTLILFPPHPNTQRAHTSQTKLYDTETRTTAGRIPPRGASSSTFIYWPQGIQCMWKTPEYSNPPHRPHVIAAPLWKKLIWPHYSQQEWQLNKWVRFIHFVFFF